MQNNDLTSSVCKQEQDLRVQADTKIGPALKVACSHNSGSEHLHVCMLMFIYLCACVYLFTYTIYLCICANINVHI